MAIIYTDDTRTLEVQGCTLTITNHAEGRCVQVGLTEASCTDVLPPEVARLLQQRGLAASDYYALYRYRIAQAVLPQATRHAVLKAINDVRDAQRAAEADPARAERRKVAALFARAKALQDDPGRFYPLLHTAQIALDAWRARFPEAARRERRRAREAEAAALEAQALQALVYDADGSLTPAEQERRAAVFRARAAARRAAAAHMHE